MSFSRTTVRRARKQRKCDGCLGRIAAGARYAEHVCSPGYIDNEHWWRLAECQPCAERYERPFVDSTHRGPA